MMHRSIFHSLLGIFINVFLFLLKFFAGNAIQSIALIHDGFNHISDSGSSIVMFFGFLYGERAADDDHPHGHGRAEYITTLVIGLMIVYLSIQLIIQSLARLSSPFSPMFTPWVIAILILSMLIKLGMYLYFTNLYQRTHSLPYRAIAVDAINDVVITGFVGLGAIFTATEWRWDAIAGLLISGLIFIQGFRILYEAFQSLMGQKKEVRFLEEIEKTILLSKGILGIHSLAYHDYGPTHRVVTVHIELPSSLTLQQSHTIIDGIEMQLEQSYPVEMVIHVDPLCMDEATIQASLHRVETLLKNRYPDVHIKNFRMVDVKKRPELIFSIEGLTGSQKHIYAQKKAIKAFIEKEKLAFRVYID